MKKINFNNQNVIKGKNINKKYYNNYKSNISPSLKEEILSPGDEDIPYSDKTTYKYDYNNASTLINESDININSTKKTLILDLDETLVHSSFKPIIYNNTFYSPDLFLTINFQGNIHKVYVLKRPFLQEFLNEMNKIYNIMIFTASVKEYANPLLDILDKENVIKKRFYREHCVFKGGKYIKNLEVIKQDLKDIILVDNNPISYSLNKNNGIPIKSWYYDKNDKELFNIRNVLYFLANVYDVRDYIPKIIINNDIYFNESNSNDLKPKTKSLNKYNNIKKQNEE